MYYCHCHKTVTIHHASISKIIPSYVYRHSLKTELFERSYNRLTPRLSNDFTAAWLTFTFPQLFAVAATLKSIDYYVAMTFILNNNNNTVNLVVGCHYPRPGLWFLPSWRTSNPIHKEAGLNQSWRLRLLNVSIDHNHNDIQQYARDYSVTAIHVISE